METIERDSKSVCNNCGWEGLESHLDYKEVCDYEGDKDLTEKEIETQCIECCPDCGSIDVECI